MKHVAMLMLALGVIGVSCHGKDNEDLGKASPDLVAPNRDGMVGQQAGGEDRVAPQGISPEGTIVPPDTVMPQERIVPKKRMGTHHNRRPGSAQPDNILPEPQGEESQTKNIETKNTETKNTETTNSQTTDNEKLGIGESQTTTVCTNDPHAHPPFLRSDLAYSVTGVDCSGDHPQPLGENPKIVGRSIASTSLKCGPHDHPMFLRTDLSYGITHEDCYGDPVTGSY